MHMPPENALARAFGDGWSEGEWLLHDVTDMLRDLQLTIVNVSPFVKQRYSDNDIRSRIPTPSERAKTMRRPDRYELKTRLRERDELMAALTGR